MSNIDDYESWGHRGWQKDIAAALTARMHTRLCVFVSGEYMRRAYTYSAAASTLHRVEVWRHTHEPRAASVVLFPAVLVGVCRGQGPALSHEQEGMKYRKKEQKGQTDTEKKKR